MALVSPVPSHCLPFTVYIFIQYIILRSILISLDGRSSLYESSLGRVVRKPAFCISENKDADHREADQRLCFRYQNSTIPPLLKYEISSL